MLFFQEKDEHCQIVYIVNKDAFWSFFSKTNQDSKS